MRYVLLATALLTGCTAPERYRAYDPPPLLTAAEREQDLKRNVRAGRSWEEQEQLMRDVKGAFGQPSDADMLGPKTTAPPGRSP
jgi:hypothetical protein